MLPFHLQWTPVRLDHLSQARYAHFFALVHHGEVLYIGDSYRTDIAQLIPASVRELDLDHLSLTVYLGRIREIGTGRVSGASVASLHQLMVFGTKPRLNIVGKLTYGGPSEIAIENSGLEPLPRKMRVENGVVFMNRALARP